MLEAKVVTVKPGSSQPKLTPPKLPQIHGDLRRILEALQRSTLTGPASAHDIQAVDNIMALALQPDILAALRRRQDMHEAVRDVATRYAFHQLLMEGVNLGELDTLSRALIRRVFELIDKRARQIARQRGENPLDVESGLQLSICKCLARYVPRKPMGAHIQWKLEHYESAVSRAMRQIKYLVTRPDVTSPFIDHILDTKASPLIKGQLLKLARGGGLRGINYAEVIRFFAQPDTVAFVKRFAATVQTARTFYTEVEYADIPWRGRRRLPKGRRQGYLDAALAELERPTDIWLDQLEDAGNSDHSSRHEHILDAEAYRRAESWTNLLHREPFEVWLTRQALAAQPQDPLWQVGRWLYLEGRSPLAIIAQGLADAATVATLQAQVATLRADPDIWQMWLATCMT